MQSALTSQKHTDRKIATTVSNKILTAKNDQISEQDSLLFWMGKYFEKIVDGSKDRTIEAKTKDLKRFLSFMSDEVGSDHIDLWTPSLTKHYLSLTRLDLTNGTYRITDLLSKNQGPVVPPYHLDFFQQIYFYIDKPFRQNFINL